jgi:diguanylate cyclase (GGDEF)-like protein
MTELGQRPIRVLLVESGGLTVEALREAFRRVRGYVVELEWEEELAGALARVSQGDVDAVLLDPDLPDSNGLSSFERLFAFAPDVPVIILSTDEDEELAVRTVQWGAQDYLLKREVAPSLVVRSVRYAIERHRLMRSLKRLALIDDLTGLYNRRGFLDLGAQYLKLGRRNATGLTVVFADVDRMKTINDTLGHHVGDRVLKRVADTLLKTCRASDLVARVGEDEFGIIAIETVGGEPEDFIRRLRGAVGALNGGASEPYQLSVSVGIARHSGDAPVRLEALLEEAESAVVHGEPGEALSAPDEA